MKYRAEIDGLRAIAVLSVILFHSGVSFLPGGFVGVDVFFVISGYLITAIIIGQMKEQTFSAADFYLRRAKRILPALFAMMFVTALVGAALLTPPAFERLMRSIGEASLSISNFSFARAAGYFDEGTAWRPMLHTWSLGVEEQFYLFLPLYLFIARSRTSWSWQRIVSLPMVISFAIAVVMVRHWPTAAYYLPFGRFWELLVGSLLATGTFGAIRDDRRRQAASAAGLALIAIPVLFYGENTTFPGETALLPCLGAFLILHSARSGRSFVSTALAFTPLAFIGKLSYSLYLWHWPVLYFARIIKGQALTSGEGLALLPLTFAVSYAAWRFIENPARRSDVSFRTAAKLVSATVATCIGLWVVTEQLGGMPGRFSGVERRMASGARDTNPDRRACDTPSLERLRAGTPCVLRRRQGARRGADGRQHRRCARSGCRRGRRAGRAECHDPDERRLQTDHLVEKQFQQLPAVSGGSRTTAEANGNHSYRRHHRALGKHRQRLSLWRSHPGTAVDDASRRRSEAFQACRGSFRSVRSPRPEADRRCRLRSGAAVIRTADRLGPASAGPAAAFGCVEGCVRGAAENRQAAVFEAQLREGDADRCHAILLQ